MHQLEFPFPFHHTNTQKRWTSKLFAHSKHTIDLFNYYWDFGFWIIIAYKYLSNKSQIVDLLQIFDLIESKQNNNFLYTIQRINKVNKCLRFKVAGCCHACSLFIYVKRVFMFREKKWTQRRIGECKYWLRNTSLWTFNLMFPEYVETTAIDINIYKDFFLKYLYDNFLCNVESDIDSIRIFKTKM